MLRKKLLISYLSLLLAMLLVIGIAVFGVITKSIDAQMTTVAQTAFQGGVQSMESRLDRLRSSALAISVDESLQAHLQRFAAGEDASGGEIRNDVFRVSGMQDGEQLQLYPVGPDGGLYHWNEQHLRYDPAVLSQEAWYPVYTQGSSHVESFSDPDGLLLVKNIISNADWRSICAVLVLRIRSEGISTMLSGNNAAMGTLFLTTQERVVAPVYRSGDDARALFDAAQEMPYIRGGDMVFFQRLRDTGFYLVGLMPLSEILEKSAQVQRFFLLAAAAAIMLSVLLAVTLSRSLSRPIIKISNEMKNLMGGNLDARLEVGALKGEFRLLVDSYNYMTQVIKDLLEDVQTAQQKEREAALQALQAQINPHFLYNTLDSINWMCFKYGAEDIQLMVHSLATMLRHSLNNGKNLITVRNELEQLRSYLYIQKIRYNNSITEFFLVDPNILDQTIIKLILQPLVENAIIHGFVDLEEGGSLLINGYQEQSNIVFDVMNNGRLIDLADMERRLSREQERSSGYGINNVNARLIHQYGEAYSLRYSIYGEYTVARVQIPMGQEGQHEDDA